MTVSFSDAAATAGGASEVTPWAWSGDGEFLTRRRGRDPERIARAAALQALPDLLDLLEDCGDLLCRMAATHPCSHDMELLASRMGRLRARSLSPAPEE